VQLRRVTVSSSVAWRSARAVLRRGRPARARAPGDGHFFAVWGPPGDFFAVWCL